ncbi:MAG: signal peptidase I [Chthoniobacter sp.]|nr:signal peptidase I [Chthoniobacter sp.]
MFSFFASKHVKQGRQFVKDARKLLAYKRDLWSVAQVADFEGGITRLEQACGVGEKGEIENAAKALDEQCGKYLPPVKDAGWRENCEVFLVAIVVALGVRTYFLQPFTIPTGSMWPTLNGINAYPTTDEPPNVVVQILQAGALGRTWINVVAKDDESVAMMDEVSRFRFFTYTQITMSSGNTYLVHAPRLTVRDGFQVNSTRTYRRGEPIVRGYVDTGDHVFVDKMSYHFRTPRRGEVFVFNTQKLPTIERRRERDGLHDRNNVADFDLPDMAFYADRMGWTINMDLPSQFYIKRLVGVPGDELQINSPQLVVNGSPAQGRCFERVMAQQDGYRGYAQGFSSFLMPVLRSPNDTYKVPERHYWAMGDNSYHSSDSRDWGPVPERNLMGRGVFVYWPFASHWGLIH